MSEIDRLGRSDAIATLKKLRSRARNQKLDADRAKKALMSTGVRTAAAFGAGYYMGGLEHDWQQLVAEKGEEEAAAEDPRKVAGIDIDLLGGLALTFLGGSGTMGKAASDIIQPAGEGILSGWAFSTGASMGQEAAAEPSA